MFFALKQVTARLLGKQKEIQKICFTILFCPVELLKSRDLKPQSFVTFDLDTVMILFFFPIVLRIIVPIFYTP